MMSLSMRRAARPTFLQRMVSNRTFVTTPIANEKMSVRESINSAMSDEIERDPNVFLIGEEVA